MSGRVLAGAWEEYSRASYTAYSSITTRIGDDPDAHARPLDHAVDAEYAEELAAGGWIYDARYYSACGLIDRVTRYQRPYADTILVAHGESVRIEALAVFRPNIVDTDTREFTCSPVPYTPGVDRDARTEVSAHVTLEELTDGVALEFTDEDYGHLLRVELRAR